MSPIAGSESGPGAGSGVQSTKVARAVRFLCSFLVVLAVGGAACGGQRGRDDLPTPTAFPEIGESRPVSPSPAAGGTTTAPSPTAEQAQPTWSPGERLYVVQPGDTLFSVARRFGTTVEAIATRNGIVDPSRVAAGMTLVIPAGAATPEPTADVGPSRLVRHGDRGDRRVALTFDMGGRVDPALDIVRWLIDHRVPATIFITGAMVESTATEVGRQVVALVAAHPDLFELGNHSYGHQDFRELGADAIAEELARTEAAVARVAPTVRMRPRFRPPYGGVDEAVLAAVGRAGYGLTVLWDVDTVDWRPVEEGGPDAAAIVAKVTAEAQGGSIVLMHLGGYETLAALPGVVEGLRARGFGFGRVSDLVP